MGGFNFTNLGNGSTRTSGASVAQIEDGSLNLIGSVAGTNTITGTLTPAITAYVSGQFYKFVPANNNTGATTINLNGVGAISIKQAGSFALAGDELVSGTAAYIYYDGTNFQLLNPQRTYVGVGENDTSEHTFEKVSAGNASGNTFTRRIVGSGSNAVATVRNYIGSTKIWEVTSSLFTIPINALFSTFADFTDQSTPAAPGAGLTRVYTKSGRLYIRANGGSETLLAVSQDPTVQRLTSGSGATYTPTSGMVRIRVRMLGPGAGGGAQSSNSGNNGAAATSFQGSAGGFTAWTAAAGNGGAPSNGNGGAGGSGGTDGTGTKIVRISGQSGGDGQKSVSAGAISNSGPGGNSALGGAGSASIGTGKNAATNSGSGGSGGGSNLGAFGAGGGAGEYVEFWVSATQLGATATYTVGGKGTGGAAGGVAGGDGADGIIIIEEFFF